jgi:hypothetical protein
MSFTEDEGYDAWYGDDMLPEWQDEWIYGFHRDKSGKLHRISEMQTSHLRNVSRLWRLDSYGSNQISLELEFREQRLSKEE